MQKGKAKSWEFFFFNNATVIFFSDLFSLVNPGQTWMQKPRW